MTKPLNSASLTIRAAQQADLPQLIEMLADDPLGAQREDTSTPLNPRYSTAFDNITQDPNNLLAAAWQQDKLVGMLQLTFIPYLTHTGSKRCLIEGVRIHADCRGQGLGEQLIYWGIEQAKLRDCNLVQLTSDKTRTEALAFYTKLGFIATHEGFKMKL